MATSTPDIEPRDQQSCGWLQHFPLPLFASTMGLAGLTLAWMKADKVLAAPALVADSLRWLTTALWLGFVLIYLLKLIRYPAAVTAERDHPVKLNFFAAISIGLLLLANTWTPVAPHIAAWLWYIAALAQLLFTLMTINIWLFSGQFKIAQLTPAWFIPAVGNILVPLAGVHYAPLDVSWFFFSVGMLFWLILLSILMCRLFFHAPLPDKLVPTLFILVAPPAAGCLAYLALNGGQLDTLARLLYFVALFFTLLLATQVVRFIRLPFFITAWGYSFPLAAISIATLEMAEQSGQVFYLKLGSLLLAISTAVIALITVKTLQAIIQGKVFIAE